MSDSPPSTHAQPWLDRGGSDRYGPGQFGSGPVSDTTVEPRPSLVRIAVAPAVAMAVLGAGAAALVAANLAFGMLVTLLVVAVFGAVVVLFLAAREAKAAGRAIDQQVDELALAANSAEATARASHRQVGDLLHALDTARSWPAEFRHQIGQFAAQVRGGERPTPHDPTAEPLDDRDPLAVLARDHREAQHAAQLAVLEVAKLTAEAGDPAQRLTVFAKFGRRQQSLVHRAIRMLDDLEGEVEEPDLLKGLYRVDHLVTGMRRQAENLVVLGGAKAPRQWSKPLTMVAVMRSAVAEVEQYNRVKLVLPIKGTLRGHAVAEIIHLLAELVENATVFSGPDTTVLLRAQNVQAGLAIEVEDRGLGIQRDELDRINGLLAGSSTTDIGELLSDGLIGLWVVAQLARRNEVRVRLQTNIFGGTTADIVVPHTLLGGESDNGHAPSEARPRELVPAGVPAAKEPAAQEPAATPRHSSNHAQHSVAEEPLPALAYPALSEPVGPPQHLLDPLPATAARASTQGPHRYRWPDVTDEPPMPADPPASQAAGSHTLGCHAIGGDLGSPVADGRPLEGNAIVGHVLDNAAGERPVLPKRAPGTTHLAPELRDLPAATAPLASHTPDLMASFQKGFLAASEDYGDPFKPTDRTN